MKISELWLRDWVNPNIDLDSLMNRLTMAGLEIESISPVAGSFNKVIIAEILSVIPHPNADKLSLCTIHTGSGDPIEVVCGAKNVRPGLKVALAQIGAVLPNGLEIKKTKLRDVWSSGMLCSAGELGFESEQTGILELDNDAPVGGDLRLYLKLDDNVLELNITPNRADCLSIYGIAREVHALTQAPLLPRPTIKHQQPFFPDEINVTIEAPQAAPAFYGRIIRGINTEAKTPMWMLECLRRCGIKPIHPIVDIGNYLMLEFGQPMHAYDLNQISNTLQVRFARPKEELLLLDGQKIVLDPNSLVISDDKGVLSLAGIMGGKSSSIHAETTDIFLESAYFNPLAISGRARSYGLHTESSQRFERGVDPNLQRFALERASDLIVELLGGKIGPIIEVISLQDMPENRKINFDFTQVKRLTGLELSAETEIALLERLGLSVEKNDKNFEVIVPSYRVDLQESVDLVEEVLRLNGYNTLPKQRSFFEALPGKINLDECLTYEASVFLANRGYYQSINYSFVDPELQTLLFPEEDTHRLLNPISSELSEMRVSLWPGLLATLIYNLHRQQSHMRLFETGTIFLKQQDKQVKEVSMIAGLLTAHQGLLNWTDVPRELDFYDIKGDLESLFMGLKCEEIVFLQSEHSALHPNKTAKITKNGETLGWCGVLHPQLSEALGIKQDLMLFEFQSSLLHPKKITPVKPISKYPKIQRDLALLVDEHIDSIHILDLIKKTVQKKCLKSLDIFDIYKGNSIPTGKKSLAIALHFQDDARTLTDKEINVFIQAILDELYQKLAITLREQS